MHAYANSLLSPISKVFALQDFRHGSYNKPPVVDCHIVTLQQAIDACAICIVCEAVIIDTSDCPVVPSKNLQLTAQASTAHKTRATQNATESVPNYKSTNSS